MGSFFIIFFLFFIILRVVLRIIRNTRYVGRLLSPRRSRIFLAGNRQVIRHFIRSRLRGGGGIFSVLVGVDRVFECKLLSELITMCRVLRGCIRVVVLISRWSYGISAGGFVGFFDRVHLKYLVPSHLALQRRKNFRVRWERCFR